MFTSVGNAYEHALAHVYHKIDKRGLLIDTAALDRLRQEVTDEIRNLCTVLSTNWSMLVYVGEIKPPLSSGISYQRSVNINASSGSNSLLNTLKSLGYNVPVTRKKNKDKEWEFKESADELALQKMFADTGDINLKHLMRVKELVKLLGTYINARLYIPRELAQIYRGVFYSSYGVASTITGRRGCSKHPFGYGGNAQTFPSHTLDRFTHDYRRCIVSRPGCVFFSVDQKAAEMWPTYALAGNVANIAKLASPNWPDNDPHTRLASFCFNIPVSQHSKKEWKDEKTPAGMMRYVCKQAGHAFDYDIKKNRLSEHFARLGYSFTPQACGSILEKIGQYDPSIQGVFHKYIQDQINSTRTLVTPLGRERQFFGFRPNSDNADLWKEAYAQIPQSTVGDNTGLAVLYLEAEAGLHYIVNEAHDSIKQEVPDNLSDLEHVFLESENSFDRELTFYNGIKVKIPIEADLSYNFEDKVTLRDYTIDALREAYHELQEKYAPKVTCVS